MCEVSYEHFLQDDFTFNRLRVICITLLGKKMDFTILSENMNFPKIHIPPYVKGLVNIVQMRDSGAKVVTSMLYVQLKII